ncbi:MAG: HEPN domain-containing protein, partial [Marinobacterium sp.]
LAKRSFLIALRFFMVLTGRMISGCLMLSQGYRCCEGGFSRCPLDLNMASHSNQSASDMAQGIWSHFEKGISDILSFKNERASVACWEFHLAIEKSIKVLIYSKSGSGKHGHNLDDLIKHLSKFESGIDSSGLAGLPSDKDAIKLRYAEMIKTPIDAFEYYLIAIRFVGDIVSRLEHKIGIKNASFTLKMAPWAR